MKTHKINYAGISGDNRWEMQRGGSSLFPSVEASLKLLVLVGIHFNKVVESVDTTFKRALSSPPY